MGNAIFAFIAGLLFGLGLIISGMANPEKVLSFLDIAGAWDPSLMLVMGGAITVGLVSFRLAKSRTLTLLGLSMHLPSAGEIDKKLVYGGLAFGAGWGLAGFCPGPAIVATGAGELKALIFVSAMLVGMKLFDLIESKKNNNNDH